jgi:hypothetical protein
MKIISIIAPVNGIVTDIGDDTITIYIRRTDDHNIYSPTSGTLTNIYNYQGSWYRHIFQADVNKIARTTISIKNPYLNKPISFWLEVGKPKYITDRIRLNKNIGNDLYSGENIGEIILGSLAEIHFNGIQHYKTVTKNSILIGGRTLIACIILSPDNNTNKLTGETISKMCILTNN